MLRRHDDPAPLSGHPSPDPALRDEVDPDPLVEEATGRLREQLQCREPVDQWGRPVAWRQVARIALGPLASPRVRDARTADLLEESVVAEPETEPARSVSPETRDRTEEYRRLFQALDDTDRLLHGR
jgi:hypothetical protein